MSKMMKPPKRGARRKGAKPPASGLDAEVPRKLTEAEITERSRRLARKQVELCACERAKKRAVRSYVEDIKECRAEIDKLAEEVVHGEEMVAQGDLFAPPKTAGKPATKATTKGADGGVSVGAPA